MDLEPQPLAHLPVVDGDVIIPDDQNYDAGREVEPQRGDEQRRAGRVWEAGPTQPGGQCQAYRDQAAEDPVTENPRRFQLAEDFQLQPRRPKDGDQQTGADAQVAHEHSFFLLLRERRHVNVRHVLVGATANAFVGGRKLRPEKGSIISALNSGQR